MKFWSTTFDYIVDSDSDPDLVRRTIGMGNDYFQTDKDYVLLLIDAKKYGELGSLTFSPTYKNMQEFVIKARASATPEDQRRIMQVLSDDYTLGTAQRKGYRQLMEEVQASKIELGVKKDMDRFLTQTFGDDLASWELFELRYQLEKDYGMYKEYAGNGLTKSEHVGPQQFATVETFSVETNPNTLQKLLDDNIIHIVELGKHQK